MNCADVRHLILTADATRLRDRADGRLRDHLESCAACAADVEAILADMSRLRAALIARGARAAVATKRRPRRHVALTLVPLALAAELALFAFLARGESVNAFRDRPAMDDTVTTTLPLASRGAPAAVPDIVVASSSIAPAFRVLPADGRQQVPVIAAFNPRMTVVWITPDDSL